MRKRLLLSVLLLVACNDPIEPIDPPVVRVSPATQWSGNEVYLTSPDFISPRLPVVRAEGETLPVVRVSDSVVTVHLPEGATGKVTFDVQRQGKFFPVASVQRVGFRERRDAAPGFAGLPLIVRQGGRLVAVGGAGDTGPPWTVVSLDLQSFSAGRYPGAFTFDLNGVSPTRRPDQFVARDAAGIKRVWLLWPVLERLDSIVIPDGIASGFERQVARLSDSVWFQSGAHNSVVLYGDTPRVGLRLEDPEAVVISPRGDLATIAVHYSVPGVPVLRTATGDTAYSLGTGVLKSQAAAFSEDGEFLYFLAGRDDGQSDSLIKLRAATGELAGATRLPETDGMDLAADPVQPLLYAQAKVGGRPVILVYDTETLTLLARLSVPDSVPVASCDPLCFSGDMAADRVLNRLYVVWQGTTVWSFDLLP